MQERLRRGGRRIGQLRQEENSRICATALTPARNGDNDDEFARLHLLKAESDRHNQHGDRGECLEPAENLGSAVLPPGATRSARIRTSG